MSAAAKHTPTPWRQGGSEFADRIFPSHPLAAPVAMALIGDGTYPRDVYEANAVLIVTACNAHEALVAALRELAQYAADEINVPLDECVAGPIGNARAALALAEVKP